MNEASLQKKKIYKSKKMSKTKEDRMYIGQKQFDYIDDKFARNLR